MPPAPSSRSNRYCEERASVNADGVSPVSASLQLFSAGPFRKRFQDFTREIPVVERVAGYPVFTATHDHEIIGGNDDRVLAAAAGRAIRILRKIGELIRNQPELAAVEAALIARSGRRSTRESDPALRHDTFALPGAS